MTPNTYVAEWRIHSLETRSRCGGDAVPATYLHKDDRSQLHASEVSERFIQTYVVVTGSNPLVNQAVEKFRLWLIEKFKFYCSLLIDLLDAEAGVVQVIIYSPFNSSLPPSV